MKLFEKNAAELSAMLQNKECSAVEDVRKVEKNAETIVQKKLEIEKKKCASVCEIDQNNKDADGNLYQLNAESMTAILVEAKLTMRGLYVPERVKKRKSIYG